MLCTYRLIVQSIGIKKSVCLFSVEFSYFYETKPKKGDKKGSNTNTQFVFNILIAIKSQTQMTGWRVFKIGNPANFVNALSFWHFKVVAII